MWVRIACVAALWAINASAAPGADQVLRPPLDPSKPFTRLVAGALPTDMAVTAKGWVYVTGITRSPEFPTTAGAYDTTCGTDGRCNPTQGRFGIELRSDHVLMVFDPDGQLHYATFLGGSSEENTLHVAFTPDGGVWLAGATNSADFEKQANAASCAGSSGTAVWVARFDVALKTLHDFRCVVRSAAIADLVVDREGDAWLLGTTGGDNVPVANAWQARPGGQIDMFALEISPGVAAPRTATYIGGNSIDAPGAIAIAPNGSIVITGNTTSTNFPVVRPYQSSWAGPFPWSDGAVVSLDRTGTVANFSTLIGGGGNDTGGPLVIDASGNIFVAFQAASDDLPTAADAYDRRCGTSALCSRIVSDVYVAKFSAAGALLAATYLGGTGVDYPRYLSVLADGTVLVGGSTQSADFPVVRGLPLGATPAVNVETGFISFLDPNLRSLLQSTLLSHDFIAPTQEIDHTGNFTYVAGQMNLPGGSGMYLRKFWRLRQ